LILLKEDWQNNNYRKIIVIFIKNKKNKNLAIRSYQAPQGYFMTVYGINPLS
jgi:hypothetical protein